MTAPPELFVPPQDSIRRLEKEREVDVCILMLKRFDMLGIIAGSAVGGEVN